jgi:hypothetical protein
VAQRWIPCDSAPRRPQAQRSVNKHGLQQRAAAAKACQKLCRTACACATDAQQALTTLAYGLQATSGHEGPIDPRPRDGKRGRPGQATAPAQVVDQMTGALTAALAAHEALIAPQRCCILATTELDEHRLSPQALLAGDKGQQRVERGCRCLQEPRFLASSPDLKKPARVMALLMVMTACVWCMRPWTIVSARRSRTLRRRFPTSRGNPSKTPRPVGSSSTGSASIGSVFVGREPSC